MKEYRIPSQNLATFTAKIDKLNKRATKLGCKPIIIAELRIEDIPNYKDVLGDIPDGTITRYHILTVEGEAPKLNGWSFVATLQHLPDGNLIKSVIGEPDLPEQYRSNPPVCDYCHKDWLHRKDTFIVRNEQGEMKQIGRNCLADFLGHQHPENIARFSEILAELEGELEEEEREYARMPREPYYFQLDEFLAMTVAVIEQRGWVSKKTAYETEGAKNATVSEVLNQILSADSLRPTERIHTEDKHYQLAQKATKWVRTEVIPKSDYEHNMVLLTKDNVFPIDGAGTIASLIPMYQREVEKREAVKHSPLANSQYVGKEGDKLELKVKVTRVIYVENGYGYRPSSTAIIKMLDKQGNLYTWFTSSGYMEQDKEYTLKGTVKRHQEYKGIKETVLTRCKAKYIVPVQL